MLRWLTILILKLKLLDLCLALRTSLPTYLWTLITTDMDILVREEFADLSKNILKEAIATKSSQSVSKTPTTPQPTS